MMQYRILVPKSIPIMRNNRLGFRINTQNKIQKQRFRLISQGFLLSKDKKVYGRMPGGDLRALTSTIQP